MRKLVAEGFLREREFVTRDGIVVFFAEATEKCGQLWTGASKVSFDFRHAGGKAPKEVAQIKAAESKLEKEIRELQRQCYKELVSVCKTLAASIGERVSYTSIMPTDVSTPVFFFFFFISVLFQFF